MRTASSTKTKMIKIKCEPKTILEIVRTGQSYLLMIASSTKKKLREAIWDLAKGIKEKK